MRPLQVVVIDDEPSVGAFVREVCTAEGHSCHIFYRSETAIEYLSQHSADLALIDVYLGTANGIDLARTIRATLPHLYAVTMTAHISLETAAASLAEGATEYVGKPLSIDNLLTLFERANAYRLQCSVPNVAPTEPSGPRTAMIGSSPKMLEVYNAISRVAPSNASVLILGASGTGKELVARALHRYSSRAAQPFIPVNCGSFTESILESELFGHEKGAFTGAQSVHKGLLESASGGTVFLDEVTETTLSFQVKLLRMLQEQEVRRVGSNRYLPIDVRVLAASNQDVDALIRQGAFRQDLYYRLSMVKIVLPALRERREDIPLLVTHFIEKFNSKDSRKVAIEPRATKRMQEMEWHGNVRELENMVGRLAIFAPTGCITLAAVEQEIARSASPDLSTPQMAQSPDRLVEAERQQITRVLNECRGNKSEAARRLGIERKTLYKKAVRLGISLRSADSL